MRGPEVENLVWNMRGALARIRVQNRIIVGLIFTNIATLCLLASLLSRS